MTVGLILNNQDYGVAIADSQITIGDSRSANLANKLLQVNAKEYHGAMVGSGDAITLYHVLEQVRSMKPASLAKLLDRIKELSLELPLSIEQQMAEAGKKIQGALGVKSQEAPDEMDLMSILQTGQGRKRDEYAKLQQQIRKHISRLTRIQPRLEMDANKGQMFGGIEQFITHELIFAAYDKKASRIRKYVITSLCYGEDSSFETITGSGTDASELELMKLLPGIRLKERRHPEIAFFALCAFVRATQNVGVGGIPKIALISKERTRVLKRKESVALANIIAAYQAELVTRVFAEQSVEDVIGKKANYEEMARKTGKSQDHLCGLLTPMDYWIAYANEKRYASKHASRRCKR
ncbi:MAG: hypothetical protein KJ955_04300 [Nanoarchaeota archaeon]|nr:hypothetical protein [Nanoarchaeota archaeon]